jgi:hypothetical protein
MLQDCTWATVTHIRSRALCKALMERRSLALAHVFLPAVACGQSCIQAPTMVYAPLGLLTFFAVSVHRAVPRGAGFRAGLAYARNLGRAFGPHRPIERTDLPDRYRICP